MLCNHPQISLYSHIKYKTTLYFKQLTYNHLMIEADRVDKKYLYSQNKQLRIQLKQCREVIKAHKNALTTISRSVHDAHPVISALVAIIMKENPNHEEVLSIDIKINRLSVELSKVNNQKILLEKVISDMENEQKENYQLYLQDFRKLKAVKKQLEEKVSEYEGKIGEVDYISGLTTKYRQITELSSVTMSFKNEQEELLKMIQIQKKSIERLLEEKKKLIQINVHLKGQIEKKNQDIRNVTIFLSNPNNLTYLNDSLHQKHDYKNHSLLNDEYLNILDGLDEESNEDGDEREHEIENRKQHEIGRMGDGKQNNIEQEDMKEIEDKNSLEGKQKDGEYKILEESSPVLKKSTKKLAMSAPLNSNKSAEEHRYLNTTLTFLKMQRQIIKAEEDKDQGDSSFQDSEELNCPELNILFPDKVKQIQKNIKAHRVPFLNVIKIRELMAQREKRISKEIEEEMKHVNPTQKIIKLQSQLEITRKQLTNNTLKLKNLETNLQNCREVLVEMENRNSFLVKANEKYMVGYRKLLRQCLWGRKVWGVVSRLLKIDFGQYFEGFSQEDNPTDQKTPSNEQTLLQLIHQKIEQALPSQYIQSLLQTNQPSSIPLLQTHLQTIFHQQPSLSDKTRSSSSFK